MGLAATAIEAGNLLSDYPDMTLVAAPRNEDSVDDSKDQNIKRLSKSVEHVASVTAQLLITFNQRIQDLVACFKPPAQNNYASPFAHCVSEGLREYAASMNLADTVAAELTKLPDITLLDMYFAQVHMFAASKVKTTHGPIERFKWIRRQREMLEGRSEDLTEAIRSWAHMNMAAIVAENVLQNPNFDGMKNFVNFWNLTHCGKCKMARWRGMTKIMDFSLKSIRDEEDFLVYETQDSWREHASPKSSRKRKPSDKGLPKPSRRRGGLVDLSDISNASEPVPIPNLKIKTEDDASSPGALRAIAGGASAS
ncbi:hypothetical protein N0V94_005925 [Neodidymelliopsis sp. IMI 364377]|nr:hypothetical protein N0V94_005925 [Neodidymelliopsis sp. IMI 364377]